MDRGGGHPSSIDLISNTTGIDVVIDGHDHHVIEKEMVANKDGKLVLLASSGTAFEYIGKVVLTTEGVFESYLINIKNDDSLVDEEIQQLVDGVSEEAEAEGRAVIGNNEVLLSIYNEEGKRLVRKQEIGLGNLITDAFRLYTQTDIAMINGGGIRSDLKQGDVTINDLLAVMPFGNKVYKANITGKQLLDVLEYSVSSLPDEDGAFMHVSGIQFAVNPAIPTPAVMDKEQDIFTHVGEGERRVSDVQIWDNLEKMYKPLELSRTYTLSTLDYMLLEKGCSAMFSNLEPVYNYCGTDVEILANYIQYVLNGTISAKYAVPEGRIFIP